MKRSDMSQYVSVPRDNYISFLRRNRITDSEPYGASFDDGRLAAFCFQQYGRWVYFVHTEAV